MKIIFVLVLSILIHFCQAQFVGMNDKEIASLKKLIGTDNAVKKQYEKISQQADAALQQTANPIDTVVSEGHLATDPKKILTVASLADINKIYALALKYRITANSNYLNKAVIYLNSWATINKPQGNPINDTKFGTVFEAYDLIKNSINAADKSSIESWLSTMADKEINNPRFKSNSGVAINNWNSHRLKTIGLIGYAINNNTYKQYAKTAVLKQIEINLYASGSGYDFEERDALHYHIYTLEPLLELAITLKRAENIDDFNYTSPTGSSIKKSIEFLKPYAVGEKTHEEFVNSKVEFDRKRAANNEPGFTTGALFHPDHATYVFSLATFFDPTYLSVIQKITGNTEKYPNWQCVISNLKRN